MKYVGELAGGTHLVELNGADLEFLQRLGTLRPVSASIVAEKPIDLIAVAEPFKSITVRGKATLISVTKKTAAKAAPHLAAGKLPDGKVSVTPVLLDILRAENRAMNVAELAAAFKARTGIDAAKNVGVCLATCSKRFERVDKGVYRLAAGNAAPKPRTAADIAAAARRVEENGL